MVDFITYKDKKIYYYFDKLIDPVICLHGLNQDSYSLNIKNNFIKIDLPGYGNSQSISNLCIEDVSNIIDQIVIKLKLEKSYYTWILLRKYFRT